MKNLTNTPTIGERIDDFIAYKRRLGYVYDTQEYYLKHYQKHMEEFFPEVSLPDKKSTDHFLTKYQGQTGGLYNAMAPLREFSRHLQDLGFLEAYLIPSKQMPQFDPEPPYFFTKEEIEAFFDACDAYFVNNPSPEIRALVVPAELRLLYCCGLRPKEVRILPRQNVHLKEKYIDILQSKGPKSRRIYVSDELAVYLESFDRRLREILPGRTYFFAKDKNDPYSKQALYYYYKKFWKLAYPDWQGNVPKLYSFRHHFAWSNINRWTREGTDVNAMLPYLARYMGHNCIKHTLYYFRFVPDFYPDYLKLTEDLSKRLPEVIDG